jgi:hypothetical protein
VNHVTADEPCLRDENEHGGPRGSRRATIAVLVFPCAAFALGLALGGSSRSLGEFFGKAFVLSGVPLYGPFAKAIMIERDWISDAAIAWCALILWCVILRYTPLGRLHWAYHGMGVAIWFGIGFTMMLLGGLAIT